MLSHMSARVTSDAERRLMDIVSREKRSEMMAKIGSRNPGPNWRFVALRASSACDSGCIVKICRVRQIWSFPGERLPSSCMDATGIAITGCKYACTPKSNVEFWLNKLQTNVARDIRARQDPEDWGWNVVAIWECETKDAKIITDILMHDVCNAAR